jgi:hypothetical protein
VWCEEVVNKTTVQLRDLSGYYIDLAKAPRRQGAKVCSVTVSRVVLFPAPQEIRGKETGLPSSPDFLGSLMHDSNLR